MGDQKLPSSSSTVVSEGTKDEVRAESLSTEKQGADRQEALELTSNDAAGEGASPSKKSTIRPPLDEHATSPDGESVGELGFGDPGPFEVINKLRPSTGAHSSGRGLRSQSKEAYSRGRELPRRSAATVRLLLLDGGENSDASWHGGGGHLDQPIEPPRRRYSCPNYELCLDLAAALNWDSFTCRGCSGSVNQKLLWRARQQVKHDRVAGTLCELPEIECSSSQETARSSTSCCAINPDLQSLLPEDGGLKAESVEEPTEEPLVCGVSGSEKKS